MAATMTSGFRQQDHIVLAHLLDRLPSAFEARRDDEAVAGLERPALAGVIGQHGLAGDEVAELPLRVSDVGLARVRFPDAAEQTAVLAGPMIPGGGRAIDLRRRGALALGPQHDDLLSQGRGPFL